MIAAKREAFRSEIRAKQIKQMMSKVRMQISKQHRAQVLLSLIAATHEQVSKQQLAILISWGIQGQENAVIHIGNLIIEGVVSIQAIQNLSENKRHMLGSSEYYLWLLHIFYERNHFNEEYLLYLIDFITSRVQKGRKQDNIQILGGKSIFCQHGLALLKQIISKHRSAAQLIVLQQNKQIFQSLVKCLITICEAGLDSNITYLSFSILNRVISVIQNQSNHILQIVSGSKLLQIFKFGILRVQSNIRCICYQIMTNLVIVQNQKAEQILMLIMDKVIDTYREQKQSVQVQISYLLLQCSKSFSMHSIKQLILSNGITKLLAYFILNCTHPQMLRNSCQNFKILANLKQCLLDFHYYDQCFDCYMLNAKVNDVLQQTSQ